MDSQQNRISDVVNALTVALTETQFRFLCRLFWEKPCDASDVQVISELQRIFSHRNAALFGTTLPKNPAVETPPSEEQGASLP